MRSALSAQGLCKNYGAFKALDQLSMSVPEGAIYGLIGKNGAGKTTLLRILCGLTRPDGGDYTLFGVQSTDRQIRSARRRTGAIVDAPALYREMTAEENMREQYRILGLRSFSNIPEALRTVGLEDTGKKKVKSFSQGMRQKLGIAVALSGAPDFVLLDEPVNGLDPQGILDLRELILKLNREKGVTFLISSHMLDELSRVATHYGFLDRGRMLRQIASEELAPPGGKCLRIRVSDGKSLSAALEALHARYRMVSSAEADVFTPVSITRLAVRLLETNCEIYSCHEREENLEAYFLELVGGERHA